MREIKFRIWSVYSEMMVEDSFYISQVGELFEDDCLDYRNKSAFKIMQYTGLKDKNGKEIYEGDIVSRHEGGIHFQEEPLAEHVVKWGNFGWSPFEIGEGYQKCVYGEIYEFIVIGNIYENPELLDKK